MKLEFSQQIFEKYSNISFMKIRPVGAELSLADTRDEGVAFLNFANAPNKG